MIKVKKHPILMRPIRRYQSWTVNDRFGFLIWMITIGLVINWFVTGQVLLACGALITLPITGMVFFSAGHTWAKIKQEEAAQAAQGNGTLYVLSPKGDGEFEVITDPEEQILVMEMIAQHRQTFDDMNG